MRLAAVAGISLLLATTAPAAADVVAEPEGYRGEPYRGPVPETLAGADVLDDTAAHRAWAAGGTVFVDVLPRAPKPELPEGTIWREIPHHSIPGAIWLPNTGYEALHPETLDYFLSSLREVTGDQTNRPLVFFCLKDCWMSWNAAKRAIEHGFTAVHWYPAGTDGWGAAGQPLTSVEPYASE